MEVKSVHSDKSYTKNAVGINREENFENNSEILTFDWKRN